MVFQRICSLSTSWWEWSALCWCCWWLQFCTSSGQSRARVRKPSARQGRAAPDPRLPLSRASVLGHRIRDCAAASPAQRGGWSRASQVVCRLQRNLCLVPPRGNACREQGQTCLLFLVPKASDTPLPLLPPARSSPEVNGVKLQQPAASRFWEKPCFGSCSSGLVCWVQRRGGDVVVVPELFLS